MTNPEDITDPTTAMNMAFVLMAKAFKLNYSTPTNNNQQISSNPRNRQIVQPGMNMGQDRQMQMIGGNSENQFRQYAWQNARNLNGYNEVQNVGNQNQIGNGNLVAVRAEGNAAGQNGNQIRYYNCRGNGHYARNCTARPMRRDAVYLQTQLLIAQKEEAGIQLQDEEYDLMAAAADLDKIKEVNANCILMANLQQASNSSKQSYGSNDMACNYYQEEAKKKTQAKNTNLKPRKMPSARTHHTPNASTPNLRSNNQMSRNWLASKSCNETLKVVQKVDHFRNPSSFSDSKHFVCSTCQKCVFNANHDVCVTNFLKGTIHLGLPEDIYAVVDSCETAQEIWLRVQQMMKGSDIGVQEKKAKLFNEWERFTSNEGESIESYYHRFLKLMNDLKRNKHFPEKIASNLKFLNNLQPEWSRYVTIVHQTKDLHTADYTQLYDFLKYNQKYNTKFAKQPNVEILPKIGETNALSNPVTSNSVSTPPVSKGVNNAKVIVPGMFRICLDK
nr:hypothetical protein [Tanacetum cinerariifolium]